MKRVLFYTNQFFGRLGGEEMAYAPPAFHREPVGPAAGLLPLLQDAEAVGTVVCGDNYCAENPEAVRAFVRGIVEDTRPDLFLAGPAFNAGRFGIACGDLCKFVKQELGVQSLTGLFEENPAVEMYRRDIYILQVAKSAAGMGKALPRMAAFANKLLTGEALDSPKAEGYFAKGQRVNLFREKNGADRAVDMLLAKLKGEPFETELEISVYEKVAPAAPVKALESARIALVTSGGIVPMGNPHRLPAATARFWKQYDAAAEGGLAPGAWESVHAGYDPVYANQDPNRVAPMNILQALEKEGVIGSVYPYLMTTTGNSTSVADATRMGKEMAEVLVSAGVDGVILTST